MNFHAGWGWLAIGQACGQEHAVFLQTPGCETGWSTKSKLDKLDSTKLDMKSGRDNSPPASHPKTQHMLDSRGIWFTGMDLWPVCYPRVSKCCGRPLLHASLHSVFAFTNLSQDFLKNRRFTHTWVLFWEASRELDPTAVQQTHRQLMFINISLSVVRAKTVFPFCFLSGMRE